MSTETWRERQARIDGTVTRLRTQLGECGTLEERGDVLDQLRKLAPHPQFCHEPTRCAGALSCRAMTRSCVD